MQVSEVKEKLQHGDQVQIARVVGCSREMVQAVLSGVRNSETELGQRIVTAAIKLIGARDKAIQEIQATLN